MIANQSVIIQDEGIFINVCGINNKNLRRIESLSGCTISSLGSEIYVEGPEKENEIACKLLHNLVAISGNEGKIYSNLIDIIYGELEQNINIDFNELLNNSIDLKKANKVINPRTINQGLFIKLLQTKDIVFSYGPAGTGKTFLGIAYAMQELLNKNVKKVILTRPVVEAGENLGFLPGDFIQKINPYLVPLYDAMNRVLTPEVYMKLQAQNLIEIAPLAYMRGRTFEECIVILDEAQNTSTNQMKMFLTRLGNDAKLLINGDITQIDLPKKKKSGMIEALELLRHIKDIGFLEFEAKDVVRHPLVKKIIGAYGKR